MFAIPSRCVHYVVAESGHISPHGTIGVIQPHWTKPVPLRLWHSTLAPFGAGAADAELYRFCVRIENHSVVVQERNGRPHHRIALTELRTVLETLCTVTQDGYLVPDCFAVHAPAFYRELLHSLRSATAGDREAITVWDNTPVARVAKTYAGMKFLQLSWFVDERPQAAAYDVAADLVPCEVTYPIAHPQWKLSRQF